MQRLEQQLGVCTVSFFLLHNSY